MWINSVQYIKHSAVISYQERRHLPQSGRDSARTFTRGEILAEARNLVDTSGIDALTMRRLAGAVGYSPGNLYGYVANRRELLFLLGQESLAALQLAVKSATSLDEAREAITALLRERPADCRILAALLSMDADESAQEAERFFLGRLIRFLQTLASFAAREDAEQEAMLLLALLIGAQAIESSPILAPLGFTGEDVLVHFASTHGR